MIKINENDLTVCVVIRGRFYNDVTYPVAVFKDETIARTEMGKVGYVVSNEAEPHLLVNYAEKAYIKFTTVPCNMP